MVPTPARVPSSCRSLLATGQLLSLVFRSSLTLLPRPGCCVSWSPALLFSRGLPEALDRAQAGGRRSRVDGQLFVPWALRAPGQQAEPGGARRHVARAERDAWRGLVRRALRQRPLDQAVLKGVVRQGCEPAA